MKNLHDYKNTKTPLSNHFRFYLIIILLFTICGALFWRMFQLSILKRDFLVKENKARVLRTIEIPAHRGIILDRNEHPLAVSTEVSAVWANPKIANLSESETKKLAQILELSEKKLQKRLQKNKQLSFIYLKRGLRPDKVEQIKQLELPGIFFQKEYRRFYPEGENFAHVIGFTDIDDQGQEGIELTYNHWLSGEPGKKQVLKDRLGNIISEVREISQPKQGKVLTLSLDRRIQYLAWKALKEGMKKNKAKSGSIVVMDPNTGEVLAMVNFPTYNPNKRGAYLADLYRNRAITDLFEPGSTIKTFTIINALESGQYKPDTEIDTGNGYFKVGKKVIRDLAPYGKISLQEAFKKSSSVAFTKIALSLPENSLAAMLKRVGFGEKTGSGFAGEASGSIISRKKWHPTELATLSYGYGVSITALQLAQAYSILASGGIQYPVTFIKQNTPPKGQLIFSNKISQQIIQMLEENIQKGASGYNAALPTYRIAGKTGTAYISEKGGYNEKKYIASFAGIAPVSNPKLVAVVIMREVTGKKHFGGQVAAPIFKDFMGNALRTLNIPPDALEETHETS
jgi:cell division protein FtsI (penicillin-binding protein 3)